MPRETALKRLKRQLAEAMSINRSAASQMVVLRAERDRARDAAAECDIHRRRVETLSLQRARLQGYIDRVREVDSSFEPETAPMMGVEVAKTEPRRITAGDIVAMSDSEFAKVLENEQARSRLDSLMGRSPEDEFDD